LADAATVFFNETQDCTTKSNLKFFQEHRPRAALFMSRMCFLFYSIIKINEMYTAVDELKNIIPDEVEKINTAVTSRGQMFENFFPQNPFEHREIETRSSQIQSPSKWPLYGSYFLTSALYLADQVINVTRESNESPYLSLLGVMLFCATHIYYAHKLKGNLNQLTEYTQRLSTMKDTILNPPNGLPVNIRADSGPPDDASPGDIDAERSCFDWSSSAS